MLCRLLLYFSPFCHNTQLTPSFFSHPPRAFYSCPQLPLPFSPRYAPPPHPLHFHGFPASLSSSPGGGLDGSAASSLAFSQTSRAGPTPLPAPSLLMSHPPTRTTSPHTLLPPHTRAHAAALDTPHLPPSSSPMFCRWWAGRLCHRVPLLLPNLPHRSHPHRL